MKQYQEKFLSSGERIVIFGILNPALINTKAKHFVTDPQAALSQSFRDANIQKTDIVILLLHTSRQNIDTYRDNKLIDIIVGCHIDKPVEQKLITGKVVSAGHRGQRIGVAEYNTSHSSQQISNKIFTLPSNIKDYQPLTKLYDEYNKEVTSWYRNKTSKIKAKDSDSGNSPYILAESCQSCHAESYKIWKTIVTLMP